MLAHNILHIDYAAIIIIICTNYAKNCIIIPNDFISKNNLNISDFTIVLVKMSWIFLVHVGKLPAIYAYEYLGICSWVNATGAAVV